MMPPSLRTDDAVTYGVVVLISSPAGGTVRATGARERGTHR